MGFFAILFSALTSPLSEPQGQGGDPPRVGSWPKRWFPGLSRRTRAR